MKKRSTQAATVQCNFDCDPVLAERLAQYLDRTPGTNKRMVLETALGRFLSAESEGKRQAA